jgi:hypothetical protein
VSDLHAVLTQQGRGAELLRAYRDRLSGSIQQQERRLEQLDAFLREMTALAEDALPAMRIRSIPQVTAYCLRATVPALGFPVMEMFEMAEKEARNQGPNARVRRTTKDGRTLGPAIRND